MRQAIPIPVTASNENLKKFFQVIPISYTFIFYYLQQKKKKTKKQKKNKRS